MTSNELRFAAVRTGLVSGSIALISSNASPANKALGECLLSD